MKKTFKLITLVALIAFSFAACNRKNADNIGGVVGSILGVSSGTNSWPPDSVLSKFGLSSMTQPPGTTITLWGDLPGPHGNALSVVFASTRNDTLTWINNWFTSYGWTGKVLTESLGSWEKENMKAVYTGASEGAIFGVEAVNK